MFTEKQREVMILYKDKFQTQKLRLYTGALLLLQ
jgi:hypothetical protein